MNGIAAGDFVNVVREDDSRPGLLYAGTENGVYVSFDDGDHWQSLRLDLPPTSVRDIDVHGADLVIATHGRGFWILDDASPLRQLRAAVATADAWLFKPATAVRMRIPAFIGTPLPPEEPKAANPPNGAYIDYVLRADQNAAVTLEVRDASGALVRRWSSADPHPAPDLAKIDYTPEWAPPPPRLSAAAGAHRFVWNFRYQPPQGLDEADAVWAPPGRYVATLRAAGESLSRGFSIVADPRVRVPKGAYRAQFALAERIADRRAAVALAARELDRLRERLVAARAQSHGAAAARLDALVARVDGVVGHKPVPNPANAYGYPPTGLDTLDFAAASLGTLFTAVDGSDAAPSADALAGWRRLEPLAARVLARERALVACAAPTGGPAPTGGAPRCPPY